MMCGTLALWLINHGAMFAGEPIGARVVRATYEAGEWLRGLAHPTAESGDRRRPRSATQERGPDSYASRDVQDAMQSQQCYDNDSLRNRTAGVPPFRPDHMGQHSLGLPGAR